MLYIEKKPPSTEIANDIRAIKGTPGWRTASDAKSIRVYFDLIDKSKLRTQLLSEQHGLCAYCMRKIKNDGSSTKVEHYIPLSKDKNKALDYGNFLAVCDGGEKSEAGGHPVLCCDSAKGDDESLTIDPKNQAMMADIVYSDDGTKIRYAGKNVRADLINEDLNQKLRLNGILDEKGNLKYDTASCVVKGRHDTFLIYQGRVKSLKAKGRLSSASIQKEINAILSRDQYPEYAGVLLFYYRRIMNRLISQGK